jgi:hypothetical protein
MPTTLPVPPSPSLADASLLLDVLLDPMSSAVVGTGFVLQLLQRLVEGNRIEVTGAVLQGQYQAFGVATDSIPVGAIHYLMQMPLTRLNQLGPLVEARMESLRGPVVGQSIGTDNNEEISDVTDAGSAETRRHQVVDPPAVTAPGGNLQDGTAEPLLRRSDHRTPSRLDVLAGIPNDNLLGGVQDNIEGREDENTTGSSSAQTIGYHLSGSGSGSGSNPQ